MMVCQSAWAQGNLSQPELRELGVPTPMMIIDPPNTITPVVNTPPKKGFKATCKRLATTAYKKTLAKPISFTYNKACWTSEKVEPLLPLFSAVQMGSNTLIPWALTAWSRRN